MHSLHVDKYCPLAANLITNPIPKPKIFAIAGWKTPNSFHYKP